MWVNAEVVVRQGSWSTLLTDVRGQTMFFVPSLLSKVTQESVNCCSFLDIHSNGAISNTQIFTSAEYCGL